ncbi:MAG TPA: Na+/H+ antiporter [Tepidisphaeraceae bacterium]|nr:Na+/H+ antiporter [Tepidisphaeraceae bacterium]
MHPVELILGLILVTGILAFVASRVKVPYPIFLVVGGGLLSLVPNLPVVALEPDLVFLLFLPPLLYYAGLMTSWRDFWANRRPIGLLAVGCVLFTTVLVAWAAVGVFGMGWGPALVLGAIVSPPDAVAATAVMSRLRIPKRIITILEGESLVNDATALVALKFAIAAVVTGAFSLPEAVGKFGLLAVGGIAIGWAVGVVVAWVRPRLRDEHAEAVVSLMTPYIAYLPAEHLGTSGVLAAVTAGIYLGRRMSKIVRSRTRLKLTGVWEILIFLLNALVFILIGLQLRGVLGRITRGGGGVDFGQLVLGALVIGAVAVAVRMLWVYPATYVPRRLFPSIARKDPAPPAGAVFMISWTGMRGIVSLAAALALPLTVAGGGPFPHRDLIVFVTFAVILFTLVLQGLTLPLVIRWLKMGDDGIEEGEELRARYEAAHAALARLESLVALGEATPAMADRMAHDYRWQARELGRHLRRGAAGEVAVGNGDDAHEGHDHGPHGVPICATVEALHREVLVAQRRMIVKLRDDGTISDEVLRRILEELDLAESQLHG